MRLIDGDKLLDEFDKLDLEYGAMGGVAECIAITEGSPTIESNKSRPYGDCAKCIHEYGTLGCCTTVSNEWVYDCDNGMAQYEKTRAEPSGDLISREEAIEAIVCDIWHTPAEERPLFKWENYVRAVVERVINRLPSVDMPKDRPKGEWVRYKRCDSVGDEIYAVMEAPDGKFFCNQCGKSAIRSDFCPHCGADMKGVKY